MSFLTLVLKNPFRNKTRAALAIVGIAVGIATIVALGMITVGLQSSTTSTLHSGAAEITAAPTGANAIASTGGTLNQSLAGNLENISGVQTTTGILRQYANITRTTRTNQTTENVLINGIDGSQTSLEGIDITNGTSFTNGSSNQVIVGKTVAPLLNLTVGSTADLFGTNFTVVGIYDTGDLITDSEMFMSLNTLQNLTDSNGKISIIAVKVADNANVTTVSQSIENAYPNQLTTTTAADQANLISNSLNTVDTATTAISLLAIFIGGIGIINVMIMSVFERTREFGVLKAVGWTSWRILLMVLLESVILTLTAFVVGLVLGYIGAEGLLRVLAVGGAVIKPMLTGDVVFRAFVVALVVGVLGGIYPAYRASRLPPTEALRYE